MGQKGKAVTVRTTFSRMTSISIEIEADQSTVWKIITNASDYPRWNSTVVSLEGDIKEGGKVALKSTLDEKRVFKLKIKTFEPERKMSWGDGQGTRTYTLESINDGATRFTMVEKISGLMFPLYAKFIPPFDENFEQFAADLKKEAEG